MAEVFLRVDTSYLNDQGGGKARLDPDTMFQLRISPGDIVFVEGKRRTVAKVWRMKKEDWHQGKIRIDNFTRTNAGAAIGERVKVYPVEADVEAQQVVLAPPEDLASFHLPLNLKNAVNWLIDFPVVVNDVVPVHGGMPPFLQLLTFKAVIVEPENAVIITKNTGIEFSDKPLEGFEGIKRWSYEDIGGLKDELQRVRETIELPMRHPELFSRLGIDPPKGVLLYGPPGTGKTLIAKAVASESRAHFISIAGPEVISKYYGESEQKLREVFEAARQNAPSIIFIDELDSIAPRREDVTGEVERRVVAQLLTMMDGLEERGQVVVIGATNRVDAIDPALRRPGRFDREIEIGVPNENDRAEILGIHTRGMPLAGDVDLRTLAEQTHGFVGADLAALAREGAIRALRRYLPDIDLKKDVIPPEVLEAIQVRGSDFREALRDVGPSAMREVLLEVPHVSWEEVGGLEEAKQEVRELVEYPLTRRDQYEDLGIEPPKGVLLYGPPGTGKTLIAKAVATESGANFIPVRGPQLLSKWVGESERAVREVFKKARQVAPSIIFFDEMDAIAPARGSVSESHVVESVLNQILTEMDGLIELRGVMVMGATNRPDIVDPALLRAGRFDRLVFIGEPDRSGRIQILEVHSRLMPVQGSHMERVLDLTAPLDEEGIEKVIASVRRETTITVQDIDGAFRRVRRQMVQDLISRNHIALEGFTTDQFVEITLSLQDPLLEKIIAALRDDHGVLPQDTVRALKKGTPSASVKDLSGRTDEAVVERIRGIIQDSGVYFSEQTRKALEERFLLLDENDMPGMSTLLASDQPFTMKDLEGTLRRFPGSAGSGTDQKQDIERLVHRYRLVPDDPGSLLEKLELLQPEDRETLLRDLRTEEMIRGSIFLRKIEEAPAAEKGTAPQSALTASIIQRLLGERRLALSEDTTLMDLETILRRIRIDEAALDTIITSLMHDQEVSKPVWAAAWTRRRMQRLDELLRDQHLVPAGDTSIGDILTATTALGATSLHSLLGFLRVEQALRAQRAEKIRSNAQAHHIVPGDDVLANLVEESISLGIPDRDLSQLFTALLSTKAVTSRQLMEEIGNQKEQGSDRIRRQARRKLILQVLRNHGLKFEDPPRMSILTALADQTEGFVGADLEALCREAGIFALREGVARVQPRHFEEARKKVHPTMNERLREVFARYRESFKAGLTKQEQPREYQ